MKKKIITLIILSLMIITLLSGCGNGKSKVGSASKMTKNDVKILQKDYDKLSEDEKDRLMKMTADMTADEYMKFKGDLKRLYIQGKGKAYTSKEEVEKAFEADFNRKLKEKQGKLTEMEKKGEKKIQDNLKK